MATTENVISISLLAGADLTAAQFTFVSLDSNGDVVSTANNADAVGVLLNNPNTGEVAEVGIFGRLKVVASAAVTNGAQIGSAASGQLKDSVSTTHILGRALEAAGASGEVISIIFQKNGIQA